MATTIPTAGAPYAQRTAGKNYSVYVKAAMLPAALKSLGGQQPRFLVTLFVPDAPGIAYELLNTLMEAKELAVSGNSAWAGVEGFNVEASVQASLAQFGAVALVIQPLSADGSAIGYGDMGSDEAMRRDIEAWLGGRLSISQSHFEVRSIERGDEVALYAGKEFREVRFGIAPELGSVAGAVEVSAARRSARLIQAFSRSVAESGMPLAYVHYPHHWRSFDDPNWRIWLRVAYSVDGTLSVDRAIERSAYRIAYEEGVPLSVFRPGKPGREFRDKFEQFVSPESLRVAGGVASSRGDAERRAALGIEGLARVGRVAGISDELANARIYGCTIAILYGHTLCNLVMDEEHAPLVRDSLIAAGLYVTSPYQIPAVVPITTERPTFWIAWRCKESPGVVRDVLARVYRAFGEAGAERPNVEYAVNRVLADGLSCAGKIKFSCRTEDAEYLGLPQRQSMARRSMEGYGGLEELRDAVRKELEARQHLSDWSPTRLEWLNDPVEAKDSEPGSEPWAALTGPEGADFPDMT